MLVNNLALLKPQLNSTSLLLAGGPAPLSCMPAVALITAVEVFPNVAAVDVANNTEVRLSKTALSTVQY
jgi:hypothetical protein